MFITDGFFRVHHPDKRSSNPQGSDEIFKEIGYAYQVSKCSWEREGGKILIKAVLFRFCRMQINERFMTREVLLHLKSRKALRTSTSTT